MLASACPGDLAELDTLRSAYDSLEIILILSYILLLTIPSPSQAPRKPTSNGSATRPLSSRRSSHSGGEESLSRSASDSSVSNTNANQSMHKKSAPGTPQPTHG